MKNHTITPESIAHEADIRGLIQSSRDDMEGMTHEEIYDWVTEGAETVSRKLKKHNEGTINWVHFAVDRNALKADILVAKELGVTVTEAEEILTLAPADF